jgi:rhamnopyranosyl-N-acetylglucosaminyl-diphospho-decaprenol beta-1,3/1,4-galactofuranosyltransferase
MAHSVAAVVVTYNRKHDLIHCLNSIFKQTELPNRLILIDNQSTDGTPELLLENGIIDELPTNASEDRVYTSYKKLSENASLQIDYVRKFENDGGAGGFYKGMKQGFEGGFDWIWMMDDDGMADRNQLKNLLEVSLYKDYKYVNALVVEKDNTDYLAFGLKGYATVDQIKEKEVIDGFANPFNGTLIAREVIERIGMIKREMFIWGDEREYTNRVKKNGYSIHTILEAVHIHPKIKGKTAPALPFLKQFKVTLKPEHLAHVFYRNLGYIEKNYGNYKLRMVTQLSYILYFISKLEFKSLIKFIKYYRKGVSNNFVV